jgi:hypothetical protein
VITDFPKENQGMRQVLVNSDSLQNPLTTRDGETGTTIRRPVFLAERMGIEKDPLGIDAHPRGRYLRAVSDHNLVAEVQNRRSFVQ